MPKFLQDLSLDMLISVMLIEKKMCTQDQLSKNLGNIQMQKFEWVFKESERKFENESQEGCRYNSIRG